MVIWLVMIDVLVVWFGVDAEDICARVDADSSLLLGDPVLLRSVTLAEVFFISNFRPVCLLTMWFFFSYDVVLLRLFSKVLVSLLFGVFFLLFNI